MCCAGTSFWTVGAAARVNAAAATERGRADLTGLFGFGIGGADVTCLNRGVVALGSHGHGNHPDGDHLDHLRLRAIPGGRG